MDLSRPFVAPTGSLNITGRQLKRATSACGRTCAGLPAARTRLPASRRLAPDHPTPGTFGSFRRLSLRREVMAVRSEAAMSKFRIGIAILVLATALSGAALGR